MHYLLSEFLNFCSRFGDRHHVDLGVFFTMNDNIIGFNDLIQKLNDTRELTENIAKIVSFFLRI
jgi:hypothetical protein